MKLREFNKLVRALGTPAVLEQAEDGTRTEIAKVLGQSTTKSANGNEYIANQFGEFGREFVLRAADIPGGKIKQFDTIIDNSGRYVVSVQMPLLEDGTGNIMGWRCYSKGRK